MRLKLATVLLVLVGALLILAGCSHGGVAQSDVTQSQGTVTFSIRGGGAIGSSAQPFGTSSISSSGKPSWVNPDIGEVEITYDLVEVHEEELGWIELSSEERTESLSNEENVDTFADVTELQAGHYTQIRLSIVAARVEIDGTWRSMRVPSEKLKLVGEFDIQPGALTRLTLLFDADASVVVAGNSGQVLLKPVVKLAVESAPQFELFINDGTPRPISPISDTKSMEEFYGYADLQANGLIDAGLTTYRVGKVFLYHEASTGEVFIVFVQNTSGDGSNTGFDELELNFSINGSEDISGYCTAVIIDDDSQNEIDLTRTSGEAYWRWLPEVKTDGGAISTPAGSWTFMSTLIAKVGLEDWVYRDGSGTEFSAGVDPGATITVRKNF